MQLGSADVCFSLLGVNLVPRTREQAYSGNEIALGVRIRLRASLHGRRSLKSGKPGKDRLLGLAV